MQWFISNLPSYPINTFGSDQSLTLYHWSVKKVPDTPALHRATGTTYDTHRLPLNSLLRDKRRMRTIEHLVMNAQSHTHFPAGQVDSDERSIGRLPPARRHLRFLPPRGSVGRQNLLQRPLSIPLAQRFRVSEFRPWRYQCAVFV